MSAPPVEGSAVDASAERSRVVVAIDGPAGAGKSTVSRTLAQRLGYTFLDTGAIYRSLALAAGREGIAWNDEAGLAGLAARLPLRFTFENGRNAVFLAEEEVSDAIRTPEMSRGASEVSAHGEVRRALLSIQRRLAAAGGIVAEGRDVGTVVFPDAGAKFFLTASPEVRGRRRWEELKAAGHPVDLADVVHEVEERDRRDRERPVSPLRQADDAILIDSSELSVDQIVERMVRIVRQRETDSPSTRTG